MKPVVGDVVIMVSYIVDGVDCEHHKLGKMRVVSVIDKIRYTYSDWSSTVFAGEGYLVDETDFGFVVRYDYCVADEVPRWSKRCLEYIVSRDYKSE